MSTIGRSGSSAGGGGLVGFLTADRGSCSAVERGGSLAGSLSTFPIRVYPGTWLIIDGIGYIIDRAIGRF